MYHTNIEKETLNNENFRKVLHTAKHMQLVVMSIKPNDNIPREIHNDHDQFIRIEKGKCKVITPSQTIVLEDDGIVIIPAGTEHEIINMSETNDLKLYTIYTPPEHPDKTIQKNKNDSKYKYKLLKYMEKNKKNN